MELRILQYFLMVAREKNITRAAKQLHMTQPTLSRQLMQLEDELGKPLFIRGKRKIELTDEGVLLRRRAEEILSLVNKTEQEITQSEEEMVGQIMIGTGIFSSSQTVLSQVIEEFHDEYRKNKLGKPSFVKVMNGINLLKKHGVEWNAMAVVNDFNADYPLDFYHFFKELGCHYIQFAPIVERIFPHQDGRHLASLAQREGGELAEFSVTPEQWGNFLCTLFDEWVKEDVGDYYIQLFDSTLANWVGEQPGVCSMAKTCGHAGVMEFNGDVYSCDHFVFPEFKLGNIYNQTLVEMMYSERQTAFGQMKQKSLPTQCKECEFLFACNGECPKNRFCRTANGEPGLNYLCKGYHQFFKHVAPYMDFMKNELMNQRPPANVMDAIKENKLIID